MSKKLSLALILLSVCAIFVFIMLLSGCSSLRHYKKVAKDAMPRTTKERAILAPVCAVEFPVKPTKTEYKTDTVSVTDTTTIDALKTIVRQLKRQLELKPECPQINEDSLVEVLKSKLPKAKDIHHYHKEVVLDSAAMATAMNRFDEIQVFANKKFDSLLWLKVRVQNDFFKAKEKADTLQAGTKNNIQLAKWFLKHNWFWLLLLLGGWFGIKSLKAKFTLPF